MNRNFTDYIVIIFLLFVVSLKSFAQVELCEGASTSLMNGEYNVMNNVWGASTAQCIEVYPDSSYFKVTLSEHNNGNSVAAYPSIFKGCHWGWCTTKNNPMPISIREIESAPFTWTVNTQDVTGTWNAAFDIWFAPEGTGNNYSAELMIWLDYHGGATPAGSFQGAIEIGGIKWNLYFVAWSSWNYIAYRATSPIDSINADLRDFIDDALNRGYLYTPWYLHAIEAGFEIFSGGQGLTANYFSADVMKTSEPKNFAPTSFKLQSPANNGNVDSFAVTFKWQQSTDPDLETVEYILHISSPEADTVVTGITENSYTFDGSKFFLSNKTYTWYVEATDKIDTTMSTTNRTFNTSALLGIEEYNITPDKFLLYQNYPNPFNPVTKIKYAIPSVGISFMKFVQLKIYDIFGREVETLINEEQIPGLYSVTLNLGNMASGVYFYKLIAGDFVETKKMLLLE